MCIRDSLTTEYSAPHTQTCAPFNDLFALAYQSGSAGYCFADYSTFYRAFRREYGVAPSDFRDFNRP